MPGYVDATGGILRAAYALGAPEALPALPADPVEKPAACAAVAVAASLGKGGSDVADITKLVLKDPQSSYFLIAAANQSGGIGQAQARMGRHVEWAIASGAVGPLTEECIKAYPKAATDKVVTLPSDEGQAVAACGFSSGLMSSLEGADGEKAKALGKRLAAGGKIPDLALAGDSRKLLTQALDLGSPAKVLEACDARFK